MKKLLFLLVATLAIVLLLINAGVIQYEKLLTNNRPVLYQPHKLSDLSMRMQFPLSGSDNKSDSNFLVNYRWPYGSSYTVSADDEYLYAGVGAAIKIYNIETGGGLTLISDIKTPSRVLKIVKEGNYLFIANQRNGLAIYDITDIYSPQCVSQVPVTFDANDLCVKNNFVYLSDGWYGGNPAAYQYLFEGRFKIIDVTNVNNPTIVYDIDMGGEMTGVHVKGAYAYIVYIEYSMWDGTHTKLRIIDISDPYNIQWQSALDLGSPHSYTDDMGDLTVKGTKVFVTHGVNGIQCVDASNIQSPYVYHTIPMPDQYAFRIELWDTTLLVTNRYSGLVKIGISDPNTPSIPEYFPFSGQQMDVCTNTDYLFLASERAGVKVLDPNDFTVINQIGEAHETRDILIADNIMFTSDGYQGLKIFDISEAEPNYLGNWSNGVYTYNMAKKDNYLYVSQANDIIQILDISNLSSPVKIDSIVLSQNPITDILIQDNELFVLQRDSGLFVYDILYPLNPAVLGTFNYNGAKWRCKVEGNYAYIASDESGFKVLNISDPSNIYIDGFYDPSGNVYDLEISDDRAYLAANDQGLLILDISEPTEPYLLSTTTTETNAIGISGTDSLIAVTTSFNRLELYSIDNFDNINLLGYYYPSGLYCIIYWGSDFSRPVISPTGNIFLGCSVLGFVELSYTLFLPPTAITQSASDITATKAVVNGTVNANGFLTNVTFEYGITGNYGNSVTASQSPVSGNNNTEVSSLLTDLEPNTTYHYRVVAESNAGLTYGADSTFTTFQIPSLITQPASNITTSSAVMNGTINPYNLTTTVKFEYGTTTIYTDYVLAIQSPISGASNVDVNFNLTGLLPNTDYYYRVVAENITGTTYGEDIGFTTLPLGISESKQSSIYCYNFPNPFKNQTTISFDLFSKSYVILDVYDSRGNKIKDLFKGEKPAGNHQFLFDGSNLESGIYYYKLKINNTKVINKMILQKSL